MLFYNEFGDRIASNHIELSDAVFFNNKIYYISGGVKRELSKHKIERLKNLGEILCSNYSDTCADVFPLHFGFRSSIYSFIISYGDCYIYPLYRELMKSTDGITIDFTYSCLISKHKLSDEEMWGIDVTKYYECKSFVDYSNYEIKIGVKFNEFVFDKENVCFVMSNTITTTSSSRFTYKFLLEGRYESEEYQKASYLLPYYRQDGKRRLRKRGV